MKKLDLTFKIHGVKLSIISFLLPLIGVLAYSIALLVRWLLHR
jgi:hypothetical protein